MGILSLDPGFGDCKISYLSDQKSRPEYFKHLNMIARIGNTVQSRLGQTIGSNIVELNGVQYLIGHSAAQASESQVLSISDYNALRDATPIILKRYIDKYQNIDHIVVSLSLAYIDHSKEYKDYLIKTLNLDPKKLSLVPQGVGCKIALDKLGFNLNDPSFKISLQNYLGVDIGFNTIDVIKVINGSLIVQNIHGFPGMGVIRMMNAIKNELPSIGLNGEFTLNKVKSFMSQGYASVRGSTYDLTSIMIPKIEEYILEVKSFLEKEYKEDLDSIDCMVLFGGGANIIRDNRAVWDRYYPSDFVRIPDTGPEYYNSLGGLFFPNIGK